eukprot:6073459-Heterocapsa_arctica.AAC.1
MPTTSGGRSRVSAGCKYEETEEGCYHNKPITYGYFRYTHYDLGRVSLVCHELPVQTSVVGLSNCSPQLFVLHVWLKFGLPCRRPEWSARRAAPA